jgi:hypothetical protein
MTLYMIRGDTVTACEPNPSARDPLGGRSGALDP